VGTRGGTPIAVAAMNEMINMYDRSWELRSWIPPFPF